MRREDFREGMFVELSEPLRVRCSPKRCGVDPFPAGATILLHKQLGPNRASVGLYFSGDAAKVFPPVYHHDIFTPFGRATPEEFVRLRTPFPNGGFCIHEVRISGIRGRCVGTFKHPETPTA